MTKPKSPVRKLLDHIHAKQAESAESRSARKRAIAEAESKRRDAELEAAVARQIAEAERLKAKAAKALPRVHAALRTSMKAPWWLEDGDEADWGRS